MCCRVVALWRSLLFCCWLLSVVCAAWFGRGVLCLVVLARFVLCFSEVTVLVYLETVNRTHFTSLRFALSHLSVHMRVHVHCPSALRREKALLFLPIHSLVLVLIVIQNELKHSCFVLFKKAINSCAPYILTTTDDSLCSHTPSLKQLLCVHTERSSHEQRANNCAQ